MLTHNGTDFTEDYENSDSILQISFVYDENKYEFAAGCAMKSDFGALNE